MTPRILSMTAATAFVLASILGCAGEPPQFDPSTRYSPASLAQEFLFRYPTLDRSRTSQDPGASSTKPGAVSKSGSATKAAQANTLDTLLTDIMSKASTIPGMSLPQACKAVADEIVKNPKITEADKKIIIDRLGHVEP